MPSFIDENVCESVCVYMNASDARISNSSHEMCRGSVIIAQKADMIRNRIRLKQLKSEMNPFKKPDTNEQEKKTEHSDSSILIFFFVFSFFSVNAKSFCCEGVCHQLPNHCYFCCSVFSFSAFCSIF